MQQQMDSFDINPNGSIPKFESALKLQEVNVTENGESIATEALRTAFDRYKSGDTNINTLRNMDGHIRGILDLNMKAIFRKNVQAQHTASTAVTLTIALATILFLIAFTFSLNSLQLSLGLSVPYLKL